MYFNAQFPIEAIKDLIASASTGDFTSTEVVDAACFCAGSLNALRGHSTFGAAGEYGSDDKYAAVKNDPKHQPDEHLVAAVEDYLKEEHNTEIAEKEASDEADESATPHAGDDYETTEVEAASENAPTGIPPWLLPIVFEILRRVISRNQAA